MCRHTQVRLVSSVASSSSRFAAALGTVTLAIAAPSYAQTLPPAIRLPPVVVETPKPAEQDVVAPTPAPAPPPASRPAVKSAAKAAPPAKRPPAIQAEPQQQPQQAPVAAATPLTNPATVTTAGTGMPVSVQENPLSVSVVGQPQLAGRAVESVAEALRDVPGVEVVDSAAAGMKRVRIRGESSRRVKILVDGQEITDHSTYGSPVLIDPSGVENIEVLRGPGSVLYGGQAVGGVVNIVTKRGAKKPVELELGGSYFSGTKGAQGSAALSGTVGRFDYRVSGSVAEHNDREVPKGQYTSTGFLEGTSFHTSDVSAHAGWTFGEKNNHYLALKAQQHRLDTESWTDPATLTGGVTKFKIDLPERDLRKAGLYYDGRDLGPILKKVHVDAFYQDISRVFINDVSVVAGPGMAVSTGSTSDDLIRDIGGTAQVDLKLHPAFYTIIGASYLTDQLDTAKTTTTLMTGFGPRPITRFSSSVDGAHIDTTSVYAQNEWALADKLKLTTGLRYYYLEKQLDKTTDAVRATWKGGDDDGLVKSAGLTYTGIRNTTLRAAYTEGYSAPTLLQMFSTTSAGGTTVYGNPSLGLETSRNYEIGARFFANGLVLDASGFYTVAKGYISSVACTAATCPTGYAATARVYDNIDTATTHGVEASLQYTLPGTAVTPYASATWSRREFEYKTFSTYNTDLPELAGRVGVKYQWQMGGLRAWSDLYVRASSKVAETTDDGSTKTLGGWGTLNLAFGGSIGPDDKFTFGIALNNLTNEEYRATFGELPGTARSIEATARIKY